VCPIVCVYACVGGYTICVYVMMSWSVGSLNSKQDHKVAGAVRTPSGSRRQHNTCVTTYCSQKCSKFFIEFISAGRRVTFNSFRMSVVSIKWRSLTCVQCTYLCVYVHMYICVLTQLYRVTYILIDQWFLARLMGALYVRQGTLRFIL